ncbi:MAG TPA: hypothetical protein VGG39_04515 [Polyangiaceae bacterium]|jgi:hypothetical protein
MTSREPDVASAPLSEEDFFDSAPELEEDNLPFDLRPIDPILVRKMTPDVLVRRGRLTRVVVGVVGCGVLLLVAALAHVRFEPGTSTEAADTPTVETHASLTAAAGTR